MGRAALLAGLLLAGTSAAQPAAPSARPAASAAPSASPSASPQAAPSVSVAASATPVAASEEDAGKLFAVAREAFKAERFELALELFQKSYAREATPGTLLNIALAEEKLGKTGSALLDFGRAAELFKADDDRLPIAREGMTRTNARAPRLKIERAAGAPPTLAIRLDGAPLAANLVGADQVMDPGSHIVTTALVGFEERRYDVTLAEGQRLPLVVETGPRVKVEQTPAPTVIKPAEKSPLAGRLAAFTVGGAGLGAIGVGVATGLVALVQANARSGDCAAANTDCISQRHQRNVALRSLADTSTGSFVVGGILMGVGVTMLLTLGDGEKLIMSAGAAPGGGSFSVKGRF